MRSSATHSARSTRSPTGTHSASLTAGCGTPAPSRASRCTTCALRSHSPHSRTPRRSTRRRSFSSLMSVLFLLSPPMSPLAPFSWLNAQQDFSTKLSSTLQKGKTKVAHAKEKLVLLLERSLVSQAYDVCRVSIRAHTIPPTDIAFTHTHTHCNSRWPSSHQSTQNFGSSISRGWTTARRSGCSDSAPPAKCSVFVTTTPSHHKKSNNE